MSLFVRLSSFRGGQFFRVYMFLAGFCLGFSFLGDAPQCSEQKTCTTKDQVSEHLFVFCSTGAMSISRIVCLLLDIPVLCIEIFLFRGYSLRFIRFQLDTSSLVEYFACLLCFWFKQLCRSNRRCHISRFFAV